MHGVFEVTSRREYRGHPTGTRFEARMDVALQRALNRGDIRMVGRVEPDLEPGSFTLPKDWPPTSAANAAQTTEAPKGASLIGEGGKK